MERDRCFPRSDLRKWPILAYLDGDFISKIKMAYIFGTTGNNAIMVTHDDEVFSIGSNISGCLGIGNQLLTETPTKVNALCGKNVKGFTSGSGGQVFAYIETGRVYVWGSTRYVISRETRPTTTLIPSALSPNICGNKVVDVACGQNHVIFLTQAGKVYCAGQLERYSGDTYTISGQPQFTEEKETNKVTAIACGRNSCMALMENGKLYGWGYNDRHQLGIVDSSSYHSSPCHVSSLNGVVIRKVVCGYQHTMALSHVGTLYTWGHNNHGQLGTGGVPAPVPTSVTLGPYRVMDIAATHYNNMSAAMTENWKIYIWGECGDQSINRPMETNFTSLYDAFATYGHPRVMWKPIHIDCNAGKTLVESWRNAFDDPNTGDLKIKVEGKLIHVHKSVLKIRCQHFRSMFQEHWEEHNKDELEMNQYSYATYRSFLQYLYTDELDVPLEHVMELSDLAKSYCEKRLQQECVQMVRNEITVENAGILYSGLLQYKVQELEDFLLNFCEQNMKEIIKTETFNALDIQTRMDFLYRAATSTDVKEEIVHEVVETGNNI